MTDGIIPLSEEEADTLAMYEKGIEAGLDDFLEVGRLLAEIQRTRLYRQSYDSFRAYCRERWGFTGRHGFRLIAQGKAEERRQTLPRCHQRELERVPEELRDEVYARAREGAGEGNKVALADVRGAITEVLASSTRPFDVAMSAAPEFDELITKLSECSRRGTEMRLDPSGWFIPLQEFHIHLRNAREVLRYARPAIECPYCGGNGKMTDGSKCKGCTGAGWLSKGRAEAAKEAE